MTFEEVDYATLNARQQEAYNFHKIAARLADFGFISVLLSDDYGGADFLAIHKDGDVLKVQTKGRFTLAKKYIGKGLHVAFRVGDGVVIYDHDEALRRMEGIGKVVHTRSWVEGGEYSFPTLPDWLRSHFKDCFL